MTFILRLTLTLLIIYRLAILVAKEARAVTEGFMLITPSDRQSLMVFDTEVILLGYTVFAIWYHDFGSFWRAGLTVFGYGLQKESKCPTELMR